MASSSSVSLAARKTISAGKKDAMFRLLEKQEEEIDSITEKIKLWTQYKDDYSKLKSLVNTMQDKIRHPYRIPIAGTHLAYVNGYIIHTNEITVLLGDNYFSTRSARQAIAIIDRRLNNIDETLKKNHEAKRKAADWLKTSEELVREKEEFVEIIETM